MNLSVDKVKQCSSCHHPSCQGHRRTSAHSVSKNKQKINFEGIFLNHIFNKVNPCQRKPSATYNWTSAHQLYGLTQTWDSSCCLKPFASICIQSWNRKWDCKINRTESGYSALAGSIDEDGMLLCTASFSLVLLAGMLNLVGCHTGRNSLRNRCFCKVSCAMEKRVIVLWEMLGESAFTKRVLPPCNEWSIHTCCWTLGL